MDPRPRIQGLRTRLLLLVLLAVVPSLTLLTCLGLERRGRAIADARTDALRLSRLAAANEARVIDASRQVVMTLAHLPQVERLDVPECSALFAGLLRQNQVFLNIGLADSAANLIASGLPSPSKLLVSDRSWYQRAVQRRDFAVGNYQVGRITHRPSLNVAYPVKDRSGRPRGVVFAALSLDWLRDLASEARLPKGAVLMIIDRDGTVLARYPDPGPWVGRNLREAPEVKTALSTGEGAFEAVGLDGVARIYGGVPLLGGGEAGGHLVLGTPRAAAIADANRALRGSLLGLALVAGLALLAAWLGGHWIVVRPARSLVRSTRRLAAGDLETRSDIPDGAGELSQLARAFDDMAVALQGRQAETRRALEALRESEERFRAFMDHSPVVAFIKDGEGRHVYVNKPFERTFGIAATSVHGLRDEEWMAADVAERTRANDRRVIEAGAPEEVVEQLPDAEGRVRTWLVVKFPIREASGRRLLGGVALDITGRQELEEELRQAQKMEVVGTLAGGVAHDFNNLLTAILGYAQLLSLRVQDDAARRDVEEIIRAANTSAALTRQLLAFSRRGVVQPRPIDLNEVAGSAAALIRRLVGADVEVIIRAEAPSATVMADPTQVEQILMNLAVNARDAMSGGGTLLVETSRVEARQDLAGAPADLKQGDYVAITVSDTGAGMDAATKARIFEPFFTTKGPDKGTGLGLATVLRIVRECGGTVQVESEPGVGSTFRIFIPRIETHADARSSAATGGDLPTGSETVLLVDDQEEVRAVARRALQHCGYVVLEARNGIEALKVCESRDEPIDALITDMIMPLMGGAELSQRITALHPQAKVLYTSGYAAHMFGPGALPPGATHLHKPFTPDRLARALRELLDARSAPTV
jgi:PAS domain S-box-containing protein